MLRLPRKTNRPALTRQQQNKRPSGLAANRQGPRLILLKNTKLTWMHFEALRIKLARALSTKRKLSRKSMFKHQKAEKKKKKAKVIREKPTGQTRLKQVWFSGFPHLAYRTKGRGSRMGKGKGNISC